MIRYTRFSSPMGSMLLARSGVGVCRICLPNEREPSLFAWFDKRFPGERVVEDPESLRVARNELTAYFRGELKEFSFSLDLQVTPFQRRVLDRVREIPYGRTASYKQIAGLIGNSSGVRAAAGAVAHNPLPIVIPCHRVIAHDGSLRGYGGGLPLKRRLLRLEGAL